MPLLDDSGIESEDKQSTVFDDMELAAQHSSTLVTPTKHMEDLDVAFRGSGQKAQGAHITEKQSNSDNTGTNRPHPPNTCRILQRKLELKVERAKRNYNLYQEDHAKKSQSSNLIPINRLPIPGDTEQKPLVDYKSESSDDVEEISFFPAKLKNLRMKKCAELSDTFSIQEMTIDSDLDSDDSASQNLELLPPMMTTNFLDKFKSCFGCARRN